MRPSKVAAKPLSNPIPLKIQFPNSKSATAAHSFGPVLLAGFGVAGTLALPKLTVFDSTATAITENLGWESAGISDQIIAASQSVGAFGLTRGTADSVVLAVLPPGGYTAQVIGADGGSGVTLIEVYELP